VQRGKVIDSITDVQQEICGFDESSFAEPSSDGRVLLLLSTRRQGRSGALRMTWLCRIPRRQIAQ
jgi:hypothetical protein